MRSGEAQTCCGPSHDSACSSSSDPAQQQATVDAGQPGTLVRASDVPIDGASPEQVLQLTSDVDRGLGRGRFDEDVPWMAAPKR